MHLSDSRSAFSLLPLLCFFSPLISNVSRAEMGRAPRWAPTFSHLPLKETCRAEDRQLRILIHTILTSEDRQHQQVDEPETRKRLVPAEYKHQSGARVKGTRKSPQSRIDSTGLNPFSFFCCAYTSEVVPVRLRVCICRSNKITTMSPRQGWARWDYCGCGGWSWQIEARLAD